MKKLLFIMAAVASMVVAQTTTPTGLLPVWFPGTGYKFVSVQLNSTGTALALSTFTPAAPNFYQMTAVPQTSFAVACSAFDVFRNGIHMDNNFDYDVSALVVTFRAGSAPQPGDTISVSYRCHP